MSHSSISKPLGDLNAGGAIGGAFGTLGGVPGMLFGGKTGNDFFSGLSQMPSSQAMPASPTTQGATQAALQGQLQNEIQLRASRTLFSNTGGGGMLEQPTPASRVLLGGF